MFTSSELELLHMELDAILDTSNDNILITDEKGIILRASANCSIIYGISQHNMIGQSVYQLQKEGVFSPSVTAIVLKEKKEVQVMQETSSGKVIMATGIPVFSQNKKIVRVITFSHDATEIQQLKEDYEQLRARMLKYETEIKELRKKELQQDRIIIKSKIMNEISDLVNRVAKSDANVVLLGESGVGKNIFARSLHEESSRKNEGFIEVNASAIPETLFESEIFGYEPGAFTGANKKGKIGMIELADRGTLFLDEIGELPLAIQVKLLKVLQEKKITRIGGSQVKNIDFRLIAATNQDLGRLVEEGKFREDLYYRLNVIPITIPPLRERKDDIYSLAQYYLDSFNKKYHTKKVFHSSTFHAFLEYDWPGNVRELENLVERLIVTTPTSMIYPDSLPFIHSINSIEHPIEPLLFDSFEDRKMTLRQALEEVEKNWLKRAYRQHKTTYEMAEFLGVSQATVVRRLKKYNINSN